MHIAVFGVGAVGGFYGTMLAAYLKDKPDHQLSFIARGKTLEKLQSGNIKLKSDLLENQLIEEKVLAYEKLEDTGSKPDIVLLCTKCKDTLEAAKAIAPSLKDSSIVVSIQNGVENEEKIASIIGEDKVIACLTNIAAENIAPAEYQQKGKYSIIFGELPNNAQKLGAQSDRLKQLTELFKSAGINAQISDDIYKDMWTKLVWNAGINPISALYRLEIGPLFSDPEHKKTILGIMNETKEVAHAKGIMIRDDVAEYQFNRTNVPAWESFKTSMLQDTLANKPIELDDLLGVVIRAGEKLGVNTPFSKSVYDKLLAKI